MVLLDRPVVKRKEIFRLVWFCTFFLVILQQASAQTPERRYACWGTFGPPVVSAQCPRNTVIQVIRAGLKVQNHGGSCAYNENDCGCEYGHQGCQMQDVRQLCMGRPACRLDVTQQYISTPSCKGFSDYMYIEFNCVQVEHNSVSEICSSAKTTLEHGFLRSPNYPSLTRAPRECDCTLTTDDGSSIELTILDIQTDDYKCETDKLQVAYDGRTDIYCGQQSDSTNKRIASKSSVVSVKFNTNGQGGGGGFWLKYQAEPKAQVKLTCSFTESETTLPSTITTKSSSTMAETPIDDIFLSTEPESPNPKFRTSTTKAVKKKTTTTTPDTKPKKKPWWWKYLQNPEKTKPFYRPDKRTVASIPAVLKDATKAMKSRAQFVTNPPRSKTKPKASGAVNHNGYLHQLQQQHPKFVQANKGKFPKPNSSLKRPPMLKQQHKPFPPNFPFDKSGNLKLSPRHYPVPDYGQLTKRHKNPSPKTFSASSLNTGLSYDKSSKLYTSDKFPSAIPSGSTNEYRNQPMQRYPKDTGSFVDKTGRQWSHLPKSLLNKLQFPVPLIQALQKELKSDGKHKSKVSPSSVPTSYSAPKHSQGYSTSAKVKTVGSAKSNAAYPAFNKYMSKPKLKKIPSVLDMNNIPAKYLAEHGEQHGEKEKNKETPDSEETVHFFQKLTAFDKKRKVIRESKGKTEKPKIENKATNPMPKTTASITLNPTTIMTTVKPVISTKQPEDSDSQQGVLESGISISKNRDKLTVADQKVDKGKKEEVSEKKDIDNKKTNTRIKYKRPESKEVRQPYWEEPLDYPFDFPERRPYPKVRESIRPRSFKRRRKLSKKPRRRNDYNNDYDDYVNRRERKIVRKKKYKMKRIWKERPDKTKVSVVRPEAKMYVDITKKGKRYKKKTPPIKKESEKETDAKKVTESPVTKGTDGTTTITVSVTEPTISTTLATTTYTSLMTDSVHSDNVVVEELAGKIETVSDFYTALDEEDWTQWPAFEMVKTAQEQGILTSLTTKGSTKMTTATENTPTTKQKPKLKNSKKKKKISNSSKRQTKVEPPTHPSTTLNLNTPTPTHTSRTPHPALLAKSVGKTIQQRSEAKSEGSLAIQSTNRRTPLHSPPSVDHVPSQSESLTNPKDNTVTIIAACVVGSLLVVIILGIVIRFVVNRKKDRAPSPPVPKARRYRPPSASPSTPEAFPGQKIPRPKRI